jgi:hypothetical protein
MIRYVTNLFRDTDLHIVFQNTNTVYDILKLKTNNTADEYTKCVICKLECSSTVLHALGRLVVT